MLARPSLRMATRSLSDSCRAGFSLPSFRGRQAEACPTKEAASWLREAPGPSGERLHDGLETLDRGRLAAVGHGERNVGVDAEAAVHRGDEFGRSDGPIGGAGRVGVARADDLSST